MKPLHFTLERRRYLCDKRINTDAVLNLQDELPVSFGKLVNKINIYLKMICIFHFK
jgi:hypothetical protein